LVIGAALLVSAGARAQALDLPNDARGIARGPSYDPSELDLNQFNLADCLANDDITFTLTLGTTTVTPTAYNIEAWLGTACDQAMNRLNGPCVKIGSTSLTSRQVVIPMQDLAYDPNVSTGIGSVCSRSSATPTTATLWFMLIDADGNPPPTSGWLVKWSFSYDFVAPPTPDSVQAIPTDAALQVNWQEPDAPPDVKDYVLLCDPPPDAGSTGEAGAGPSTFCESSRLPVGEVPTSDDLATFTCGTVTAPATSAEAALLTAGVNYAVGVVARDHYANLSPVSATACGTPQVPAQRTVTEFSRGGCSIGRARTNALGAWLGLAALGEITRRRVRRRRPRRKP
jgi:hypothetical protein